MTEKLTQFDYLLNAMHHAGQEENPALAGYGAKRRALFEYVRKLEKDAERYRWLRDCAAQEIQFDHTTVDAHIGLLIPCRWSSDPSLCDAIDAARLATLAVVAA